MKPGLNILILVISLPLVGMSCNTESNIEPTFEFSEESLDEVEHTTTTGIGEFRCWVKSERDKLQVTETIDLVTLANEAEALGYTVWRGFDQEELEMPLTKWNDRHPTFGHLDPNEEFVSDRASELVMVARDGNVYRRHSDAITIQQDFSNGTYLWLRIAEDFVKPGVINIGVAQRCGSKPDVPAAISAFRNWFTELKLDPTLVDQMSLKDKSFHNEQLHLID